MISWKKEGIVEFLAGDWGVGTKPLFMAKHLYIAVGEVHIRGGGGKIAKGSILFVFFIPIQSSLLSPIQKLAENDLYCVSRELTY